MGTLVLQNFKGELPRIDPQVLPDIFAQVAKNVKFDAGNLTPLRTSSLVSTLPADASTIYLMDQTWLSWANTNIDVAKAPVASGRIYYTGDGSPKVRNGSTVYNLALPAPTAAPTVVNLSTPTATLLEEVFYAYTYVTSLGEESAPSPLSTLLSTSANVTVRVSGFASAPAGRAISSLRIYRSQTSASGVTSLYFVSERPIITTSYDHAITTEPLSELIPSTDYDPPPSSLTGLVAMPNGMMAAFLDNTVYFCEPYVPHAWPDKYTMKTEFPIVGLAVFGSMLAVLTRGSPYIMQGSHPDAMISEKMERSLPCMSKQGIVDIGTAAIYPSTDGLVMIGPGDAKVITKNMFSRDQWNAFQPESMIAERFDGKYLFKRVTTAYDAYNGGTASGFAEGTYTLLDGKQSGVSAGRVTISAGTADSSFGVQQLGLIDYEGAEASFVEIDIEVPLSMAFDDPTSNLYLLRSDKRTIVKWENSNSVFSTSKWKSKSFVHAPTTFGAAYIKCNDAPNAEDTFFVRIYGDRSLVSTLTAANKVVRLPAKPPATIWEVEVESSVPITSIYLAGAVDELMAVL